MMTDFTATAFDMRTTGKPDAGNLLVRFDEGEQVYACSLLYWTTAVFRFKGIA
jgi:hypothetical protein